MADEPQNPPAHPGDAWLEEALLLAASELSAFRAIAQSERDRLLSAAESTRARLHALEQELEHKEQRHAREQSELRSLLDTQLAAREQAWLRFSEGLHERMVSLAAAQEQHAHDMEEQGALRQKLHAMRAQLESTEQTQAELERRLLAGEEAFALAATELQKSRDEAETLSQRITDVSKELSASAAHCAQLQIERRAQDGKLTEADAARRRLEEDLTALGAQRHELHKEREQLMLRSGELDALRGKHVALEAQAREQGEELGRRKARIDELSEDSRQLRELRAAHTELTTKAHDQAEELERQRARIAELSEESRALQLLRVSYDELSVQAREQGRELDVQRARAEELARTSRELEALRALHGEVELRAEKLRAELLDAQRRAADLDRVRDELCDLQLERSRLERDLAEQGVQLTEAQAASEEAQRTCALAEQRALEAKQFEDLARVRVQEAEADVHAARRERDQIRAGTDARQGDVSELQKQLAELREAMAQQTETRFAMLDMEKQRSAKLKAELEQLRAGLTPLQHELAQLRASQPARAAAAEAAFGELDEMEVLEVMPADDARDSTRAGLASDAERQPARAGEPQRDSLELPPLAAAGEGVTSGPNTVPLSKRSPANQVAPATRRVGTAYKFTELAEEQVYIPSRLPGAAGKGSSGGDSGER